MSRVALTSAPWAIRLASFCWVIPPRTGAGAKIFCHPAFLRGVLFLGVAQGENPVAAEFPSVFDRGQGIERGAAGHGEQAPYTLEFELPIGVSRHRVAIIGVQPSIRAAWISDQVVSVSLTRKPCCNSALPIVLATWLAPTINMPRALLPPGPAAGPRAGR